MLAGTAAARHAFRPQIRGQIADETSSRNTLRDNWMDCTRSGPETAEIKSPYTRFFDRVKAIGYYPKFVIDVGVASGTAGLYSSFPKARFVMVEPLEEFVPAMTKISQTYDARYVIAAAGPEDGETVIRVFGGLSGSSVLPAMVDSYAATDKRYRTVRMVRLDSLLPEFGIESPLVLKMDIQGAELLALDGAQRMLELADIVILETSFFKFHGEGMPEFYDVVKYMKDRHFAVYDVLGGVHRKLDDALGQVDLAFVKEAGIFRKSHAWA